MYHPSFPTLIIGTYSFIIQEDDVSSEKSPDGTYEVVHNGLIVPLTSAVEIVTFNLLGSCTFLLNDTVFDYIKNFQKTQYQNLLNNNSVSYLSFNGYGIKFTKGIIIRCEAIGGYKLGSENVYNSIRISVNNGDKLWF